MKDRQAEERPAGVPEEAKQAGEAQGRWSWVETSVWTERMLTALEEGVKGGKWFSLIDKVSSKANLRASFEKVKANKGSAGVDHVTIEMFEFHMEENLEKLSRELISGDYQPQVRNPGHADHRFRCMPTTDSGACRPLIPVHADHRFRCMPTTCVRHSQEHADLGQASDAG